jgi:hypothetical protein
MRPHTITEDEAREALLTLPDNSFLLAYASWARGQTDAALAYHIAAGLSLLAVSAPANLQVTYAGPATYGNIFTLCAGRSGEDRKSTACGLACGLLRRVAPDLVAGEPASDAGLIDSLAVSPTQLIYYSEFGAFLARAQQGSHTEAVKIRYNELYDCATTGRKKANGGSVTLENPRASLIAACAVPYLEKYTDPTDWSGGFMGRWLVMYAQRERLYEVTTRPSPALDQWLTDSLRKRTNTLSAGECLGLSPEALAYWRPWFRDVSDRKLPEYIVGARARIPTVAMKIALLLGWDTIPEVMAGQPWHIGIEQIVPAVRIAELHLQSVIAIADILCESRDMRDRRTVINVLRRMSVATFGTLIRESKMLKRRAHEIIDSLLEEQTVVRTRINGLDAYMLHPRWKGPTDDDFSPEAPSAPEAPVLGGTADTARSTPEYGEQAGNPATDALPLPSAGSPTYEEFRGPADE